MSKGLTASSGFVAQVRKYGIKKLLISWDILFAVAIFLFILCSKKFHLGYVSPFDNNSLTFVVTVASAIFSVLITALAIILSFSSSNFVKFLREKDMFDKIVFIFWWTSIVFLTVLSMAFLKSLISVEIPGFMQGIGSSLIIAMFAYGLAETYYVVGALMRFAYFLGYYESKTPPAEK